MSSDETFDNLSVICVLDLVPPSMSFAALCESASVTSSLEKSGKLSEDDGASSTFPFS